MKIFLSVLAVLAPLAAWAGDPVPGVEFYLIGNDHPQFRACMQLSDSTRVRIMGKRYCMVAASAVGQTRTKGGFATGLFLSEIPGPVFRSAAQCDEAQDSRVVTLNGQRYCMGPASVISLNSSRSNFSR